MLYGGQVAAQALIAAGRTVPARRLPHSLHGYFLRPGDSARPLVLRVYRDRDGRSFSARRVVAIQNGKVIFSMSASFHVEQDGPDVSGRAAPPATPAGSGEVLLLERFPGVEARVAGAPELNRRGPTQLWVRSTTALGDDPLVHSAVLAYVSDISSGLFPLESPEAWTGASLDHAVWFHRPFRLDEWVLLNHEPHTVARGRGFYSGTVHDVHGRLVASFTQEALFRTR